MYIEGTAENATYREVENIGCIPMIAACRLKLTY